MLFRSSSFPLTARFASLVDHLNSFSTDYFSVALERILESCRDERPQFTDSEFEQLVLLTGLAPLPLTKVVEGCTYLFERSAAVGLKPAQLLAALIEQGVNETQAELISRAWAAGSAQLLASHRAAPFGAPATLAGSSYTLVVAAGSSAEAGIKTSRAILDLQIAHETVRLELDKPQLLSLLSSLDKIQQQIDSLS